MASLWLIFWGSFLFTNHSSNAKLSIIDVIREPAFLQAMTVIGVMGTVVALALAGILKSEASGVIVSSVVGYTLGRYIGRR